MNVPSQPPDDIIPSYATREALEYFLSLPKRHYFQWCLNKSFPPLSLSSTTKEIQKYIQYDCGRKGNNGESLISPGGRHSYFRAIRCFFNWAYSPASGLELDPSKNPITWVIPPKVPRRKMPAQTKETVEILIAAATGTRNKAIISTLIDTGGRRSEVQNIKESDIDWDKHRIRAICKGDREAFMPMGSRTETLIKEWLSEYHPPEGGNIWGLKINGIATMLKRLERKTGIKCNCHTFRRGFACILRRNGVDSLDIKELGHWLSHRMVEVYTENVSFEDAQMHYKAPSGEGALSIIKDSQIPPIEDNSTAINPDGEFKADNNEAGRFVDDDLTGGIILQVLPAVGWKVDYALPPDTFDIEGHAIPSVLRKLLVCFALVKYPDGSTVIKGYDATECVMDVENVGNFLGYESPNDNIDFTDNWYEWYKIHNSGLSDFTLSDNAFGDN